MFDDNDDESWKWIWTFTNLDYWKEVIKLD